MREDEAGISTRSSDVRDATILPSSTTGWPHRDHGEQVKTCLVHHNSGIMSTARRDSPPSSTAEALRCALILNFITLVNTTFCSLNTLRDHCGDAYLFRSQTRMATSDADRPRPVPKSMCSESTLCLVHSHAASTHRTWDVPCRSSP